MTRSDGAARCASLTSRQERGVKHLQVSQELRVRPPGQPGSRGPPAPAALAQEVIRPHLTPAQRGRRVRELAADTHRGPSGQDIRVSCQSINQWKRSYLNGGFEALVPG